MQKDFIGKNALLKQREEGVKRRYVQLILSDHDIEIDPWCWGNEPIYRDGKYAGVVTTTSYGFTLKKLVKNNTFQVRAAKFWFVILFLFFFCYFFRFAWVLLKIWTLIEILKL